ncbi:MAG: tetratricopeptide repeat protein [Acidobacteria bacterium]|nr:tetratricopeptide repeat protein [Acidobacteriota bacterium]
MRKPMSFALVAVLAGLLWPAAAGAQNREHQQMTADVRMLQEQAQQLALTIAALSQTLTRALEGLNARLDATNEAARKSFADQKLQVDNLANDVRVIRERSDDTNVRITSLRQELEALRSTVQALQQIALAPPAPAPADPNAPAPVTPLPVPQGPPPAPLPSTAGLSPEKLFETARADYFAGRYQSAILGFEAYLRAFPRFEQADDAYFYIGESHSLLNQFADAIAAYNQVIQTYPGTNSVPDAYYKRGLAEERLGQADAARASYEAVTTSFPDSAAAGLAKQSLDRLARAQQP